MIQQGLPSDSRFFRYRGERDQVVPLCQESCPSSGESTRPGLLDAASSRRGLVRVGGEEAERRRDVGR